MGLITDEEALESASDVKALEQWSTNPSQKIRVKVARHPSAPAHVIAVLAFDPDVFVAHHAVCHPALPHSAAVRVASSHAESFIRRALASNSSLSLDVVEQLLKDEDSKVREAAAYHPALPVSRLLELANSEDVHIRFGVTINSSVTFSVLVKLMNDKSSIVANQAWNELMLLSDEAFYSGLEAAGFTEWLSLPRMWIMKALYAKADQ